MCGICGFIDKYDQLEQKEELLQKMNDTMIHRGPDDAGYYFHKNVALAMRRLSIIDLAGGHQPIHDQSKKVWVVLNGEIYNYKKLRDQLQGKGYSFYTQSDTEVIVHLYKEYGLEFVKHLDGMFALSLYDQDQDRLVLARDRAGQKPLYYQDSDSHFIFGSELKVLLQHPDFKRLIDPVALQQYLLFSTVFTPNSIIAGVKKLAEGHLMIVEKGQAQPPVKYWNYELAPKAEAKSEKEWIELVDNKLTEAIEKRLISDVPLGVFLSGGVDSSLIAAIMCKLRPANEVKTFSIKVDDPIYDESKWSRWAAGIIGSNHTEFNLNVSAMADAIDTVLDKLDEPMADSSILPTYVISEMTKQKVTVALAGDAGDEVFGGYPKYFAHRWASHLEKIPKWMRDWLMRKPLNLIPTNDGSVLLGQNKVNAFFDCLDQPYGLRNQFWVAANQPDRFEELTGQKIMKETLQPIFDHVSQYIGPKDFATKAMYLDYKLVMQDDFNVKVDRASMMNSLEVREPFMDTDLVELVGKMPAKYKVKGMQTKYLLKKVTEKYYPKEFIYRKKWGFGVPVKRWIREDLRPRFEEVLSLQNISDVGLVDGQVVQRLLREHIAGNADYSHPLWNLFVLHRWYDKWMKD